MLKVVFRDDWEELYKDNELILSGHKLDVTLYWDMILKSNI